MDSPGVSYYRGGGQGVHGRLCLATRSQWVLDQRRRTCLSAVPGIFCERHELALAANSGTMIDGM
eukprot:8382553-Pyramimonas_sp.AAC.1